MVEKKIVAKDWKSKDPSTAKLSVPSILQLIHCPVSNHVLRRLKDAYIFIREGYISAEPPESPPHSAQRAKWEFAEGGGEISRNYYPPPH